MMPAIKSADIFFVMHHNNPLSKVIAGAMGSRWSHSGLVDEQGSYDTHLIETTDLEVAGGWLSAYLSDPDCEVEVWTLDDLSENERRAICVRARGLRGRIYAYWQLLSLGLRRLFMRVGVKIPNLLPWGRVCCGVPAEGYFKEAESVPLMYGRHPAQIDTEELYVLVKAARFRLVLSKKKGEVL